MKKKKNRLSELEQHEQYVEFLRVRVQSKNYKTNVSKEDFDKSMAKYDKAKLKLKFMKQFKK